MKRLAALLALVAVVALASPANAVHKGTVRRDFEGPDGPAGVHLAAFLVVDDHDFQDQIRGMVWFSNPGPQNAIVHISYLRFHKNGNVIRDTGSFVRTIPPSTQYALATFWVNNPDGVYHSRVRMWVCWPGQPGDPCGSIVAWSSGNVLYV